MKKENKKSAFYLSSKGFSNEEIAYFLGVDQTMIDVWIAEHKATFPEHEPLCRSLKERFDAEFRKGFRTGFGVGRKIRELRERNVSLSPELENQASDSQKISSAFRLIRENVSSAEIAERLSVDPVVVDLWRSSMEKI